MHHLLKALFFLGIVLLTHNVLGQDRPNIVLIMADDLGGRDLPAYGNRFNETPNIDKLASQGILYKNAYAAPVCSPTRASIQAGQYPARVGIFDFIPGHWRPNEEVTVPHHQVQHLPNKITTIGNAMQAAGYKTGYFGKWHLGNNPEHLPNSRGYDQAYMYAGGGFYHPKFVPAYKGKQENRLSETLSKMGIDFIEENKTEPFFLFVSHYDVHVQLDADRDLINKYLNKPKDPDYPSNAVYAAMITHIDESVGAIMAAVEDKGLMDNTVFIFYSDNGGVDNRFDNIPLLGGESQDVYSEEHPLRYIATSNAPYRAGKGTLFEGGIRVPLIVRWPNKVEAASTSEAIVSSVDFYPTFLDLGKGDRPKNQVLDGVSMLSSLTENTFDKEREVFTHYPVYHHEVPMSALRKGDWKLIENLVTGEFDLYNLKYDVIEMTDLKFSYPDKLAEMMQALKKWQVATNAQNPVPNPDFDPEKRYEWGTNPFR
ncbi:sulfatase [uncultured Cyclobacterium sp.]|uniref:sulfatase n=1 Tax=uncultured Cyclobacterium sp. TaxID=453820 RepID=UPI0030EE2E54|tara:strand:- start:12047 stop:13498 length:1452 start_codon:yes stop_codon:yes gene_type:complete